MSCFSRVSPRSLSSTKMLSSVGALAGVYMTKWHRVGKVAQSVPCSGSAEVVPIKWGYEFTPSGLSLRVSLTTGGSVWTLNQLLDLPLGAFQWVFDFLFLNEKCMFPEELALGPRFSAWRLLEMGLSGKNKNCDWRLWQKSLFEAWQQSSLGDPDKGHN